jgi:hypothetical protein
MLKKTYGKPRKTKEPLRKHKENPRKPVGKTRTACPKGRRAHLYMTAYQDPWLETGQRCTKTALKGL